MIRRWLSLLVAQAIWRLLVRAGGILLAVAIAAAGAPAALVAAGAFTVAWWRGWQPRQLLTSAAWCGPMVLAWLTAAAVSRGLSAAASEPFGVWLTFWRLAGAGEYLRAAAAVAPAAIPAGLLAGGAAWAYRIGSLRTGAGGRSPGTAAEFDRRQWRHQVRAARARISAPASVPLTTRDELLVAGAVIRTVGHRTGRVAALGYGRMRSHQVVVGTTGTGKTTLLLRLWAGFMATGLARHASGLGPPPLLVVLDCKGGSDARRVADRVRRVLRDAGARSTAIWPDEASLSLWALPARQLTTTLVDLIEHGTGSAAYYADVMEALVSLAVEAPGGAPLSSGDLLARFEPGWLPAAYASAGTAADHALIRSASRHLGDVALRFRTLFRRLGAGLDGPGGFADADAWYCILEGTDQISVAESQARALVDLLASFAARGPVKREILLAVDEFSAVSRRLPIWQLYERARSLGLAVQVSAQSWHGLAATDDERHRIAASAEGGIWLLRTPEPEPVTVLAGTRAVVQTSRGLRRYPFWSHRGSSQVGEVPVVDPNLIRALDVGQAAYIYRGGVTYVQVKRLVATPAAVSGVPVVGGVAGADVAGAGVAGAGDGALVADVPGVGVPERGGSAVLADVSEFLDAAFGPEPEPHGGTA